VVQIVGVLDGYNRHRFEIEPDLLVAWNAASNVIGPPHASSPPAKESKPAAS
jgi:hypothetical protein